MHAAQYCMEALFVGSLRTHAAACVCVCMSSFIRSLIFERFSFSISFLGDRNYTDRHCCVRLVELISFRSCVLPTSLPANFLLRARVRSTKSHQLHRSLRIESFNFRSVKDFFFIIFLVWKTSSFLWSMNKYSIFVISCVQMEVVRVRPRVCQSVCECECVNNTPNSNETYISQSHVIFYVEKFLFIEPTKNSWRPCNRVWFSLTSQMRSGSLLISNCDHDSSVTGAKEHTNWHNREPRRRFDGNE